MGRGRKRKDGPREPNGRLNRATVKNARRELNRAVNAVGAAEATRLRDAAVIGMRDRVWGTVLGQLFLAGAIAARQFEAGRRWDALHARYGHAIGARPVRSAALQRGSQAAAVDPDSHEGCEVAANDADVVGEFRSAHAVLRARSSIELQTRLLSEGLGETPAGVEPLDLALQGLDLLANHWGI